MIPNPADRPVAMDRTDLQRKYRERVNALPPRPYPQSLETFLESLDRSSLAFIANETLGKPRGFTWPSRNDAIAALLSWDASDGEKDRIGHDRLVRWMEMELARSDESYLATAVGVLDARQRLVVTDAAVYDNDDPPD